MSGTTSWTRTWESDRFNKWRRFVRSVRAGWIICLLGAAIYAALPLTSSHLGQARVRLAHRAEQAKKYAAGTTVGEGALRNFAGAIDAGGSFTELNSGSSPI